VRPNGGGDGGWTFTTADYMLDAGRDVYAVPGSILAPECAGANRLLCQGARPITDASELALALESALGPPPRRTEVPGILGASDRSDRLLSALRTDPMRPDDAARALGLDIVTVARLVGGLETAGMIARYPDGRYGPRLRAGEGKERATMRELPPDE